ncbi:MAG: hypothetical protein J6X45_00425 [Lachnospiraceae bacterium]|nr:hypothetical protein [Lachnospiraceae bacterium]
MSGELDIIKNEIIGNPQLEISVAEMSQKVNISSYEWGVVNNDIMSLSKC